VAKVYYDSDANLALIQQRRVAVVGYGSQGHAHALNMYQGGMGYMRYAVSDTAEFGDYVSGPRLIDGHVREQMRGVLRDIQDGTFATRWILENQAGRPSFLAMRRAGAQHQIEQVGRELRAMMPWLNPTQQTSQNPEVGVANSSEIAIETKK